MLQPSFECCVDYKAGKLTTHQSARIARCARDLVPLRTTNNVPYEYHDVMNEIVEYYDQYQRVRSSNKDTAYITANKAFSLSMQQFVDAFHRSR